MSRRLALLGSWGDPSSSLAGEADRDLERRRLLGGGSGVLVAPGAALEPDAAPRCFVELPGLAAGAPGLAAGAADPAGIISP